MSKSLFPPPPPHTRQCRSSSTQLAKPTNPYRHTRLGFLHLLPAILPSPSSLVSLSCFFFFFVFFFSFSFSFFFLCTGTFHTTHCCSSSSSFFFCVFPKVPLSTPPCLLKQCASLFQPPRSLSPLISKRSIRLYYFFVRSLHILSSSYFHVVNQKEKEKYGQISHPLSLSRSLISWQGPELIATGGSSPSRRWSIRCVYVCEFMQCIKSHPDR